MFFLSKPTVMNCTVLYCTVVWCVSTRQTHSIHSCNFISPSPFLFSYLLLSPSLRSSLHLDLLICPASFFLNLVMSSFLPTLSSHNTKFNSQRISDYLYCAASADGSVVFVLRRPRNNRDGPKPRTLSDIVGMYQPSSFSLFM